MPVAQTPFSRDIAAVILQGFHFNGSSSSKPRLEISCELGCCLEDIMPVAHSPSLFA
jgi:hypothetical protein